MKTSPGNEDPLTPHFYIVKLGFTGVYILFLLLLQNIDCEYTLEPPQCLLFTYKNDDFYSREKSLVIVMIQEYNVRMEVTSRIDNLNAQ